MENLNSFKVLSHLIQHLNIPVTQTSIITELQKHPDLSSLRTISDILDTWNIPNAAYSVTIEELIETEIPLPCIACFVQGEFVLISQKNETQITVSNERWNKRQLGIDEFKKKYYGTILAFQKNAESGEADYAAKRRTEITQGLAVPFTFSGLGIILLIYLMTNPSYLYAFSWAAGLLLLIKTLGLTTSILLLVQSIDANNPMLKRFCGNDSSKNCNAILTTKAARITPELSWSEVGFFYFAGSWLALLFNNGDKGLISLLAIMNLLSLPYTFYSVYYQWRVAKQWCIFCCTVQLTLWLEFFAFLPLRSAGLHLPDLHGIGKLFISLLLPVLIWVFIKPYLFKIKQIEIFKQHLHRFKYNTTLFKKLLDEEVQYSLPRTEYAVVLGNPDAEHTITMVSNPYCRPCSRVHKVLDDWLNSKDNIKLQIIFSVEQSENGRQAKVAKHFLSLQADKDQLILRRAINDWYEQKQKNYDNWAKDYPVVNSLPIIQQSVRAQQEWCKMANITGTPTLFINGRRLPTAYMPEDIKYIL